MSLYSRNETATAVTSTPPGLSQSAVVAGTAGTYSIDKYDNQSPANLLYDGDNVTSGAQGNAEIRSSYIYIDDEEAQLEENKYRGLNAPGWWEYTTYTDASGNTRHKANHLVAFADAPVNVADADDVVAADVASAISVGTLADVSVAAGNIVTFDADAVSTTDAGTLVYVWQRRTSSTGRWVNVTASLDSGIYDTTSVNGELTIAALDVTTDLDGYEFRVKVTNTVGGEEVVSNAAALEVTP